jgi:dTDP-glucose 4,6-dehydratase
MEYKSILVTGGCGFIGSNFINYMVLKYPDTHFVNIDKLDYCSDTLNINIGSSTNYTFIKGNLTDKHLIIDAVVKYGIDCIIHIAAQSHVDNSFENSYIFIEDNIVATVNILEVCRTHSCIKKLLHVSTDEVYGEIGLGDELCTVDMKLNPTNPYSVSKASAEFFVQCYAMCYKIPVVITRGNNVYGPRQYHEKLIPKFIKLLLENKKCTIQGQGNTVRNFIHVYDTCTAFETVLSRGELNKIYNIGTDNEYSVMDVTKKLVDIIKPGADSDDWIEYIKDRPWNDLRYGINSDDLRKLGWTEKYKDFDEGLKECVEWYINKFTHIKT